MDRAECAKLLEKRRRLSTLYFTFQKISQDTLNQKSKRNICEKPFLGNENPVIQIFNFL